MTSKIQINKIIKRVLKMGIEVFEKDGKYFLKYKNFIFELTEDEYLYLINKYGGIKNEY